MERTEIYEIYEECISQKIRGEERRMKRKAFSPSERKLIYDKCNGHCAYCGCEIEMKKMQVDHVVAFSLIQDDKTNDISNLLPACRSCNHYKSSLSLESFRKRVESMPYVLMRDSVTYKNAVRFGLVTPNPQKVVFYFERMGVEVGK